MSLRNPLWIWLGGTEKRVAGCTEDVLCCDVFHVSKNQIKLKKKGGGGEKQRSRKLLKVKHLHVNFVACGSLDELGAGKNCSKLEGCAANVTSVLDSNPMNIP